MVKKIIDGYGIGYFGQSSKFFTIRSISEVENCR